jgi:hypothetical protein
MIIERTAAEPLSEPLAWREKPMDTSMSELGRLLWDHSNCRGRATWAPFNNVRSRISISK